MSARDLALGVARIGWVGGAIAFLLRHFSRALPIKRVYEDERLVGFLHPAPSYEPHVLIVPKARARTLFDLRDEDFLWAVKAAERIVAEGGWGRNPYQLRINGGARQDVMQAHFHLIPAAKASGAPSGGPDGLAGQLRELVPARGFSVVFLIDGAGRAREGFFIEY